MRGWAIAALLGFPVLAGCGLSDRPPVAGVGPRANAGIQALLAAREYHASENGKGLQAPNRRHNLRTYFDAAGIRVHDRTAGGSPELLQLSLARVGRVQALAPVPRGTEVVAREDRVEIRRPGLVEWFVNGPDGLEQGFTLAERPEGEGRLALELRLESATARPRGEDLVFETHMGRKLAYGKLAAWDAHGAPLAAELALADAGRIAMYVDDTGARYPIVIDPLLEATADTLLESDQASANLGTSVASAGDVNGDGYGDVIVGALLFDGGESNEGAAFVFHGSPTGIPDAGPAGAATRLESNQVEARLGISVASAGDVDGDGFSDVIVGANLYDSGQADEGAAFVFLGSPTGIADGTPATAHARLEGDQAGSEFGTSVASAGDVDGDGFDDVIVGAQFYDNGEIDEGAAFVFLGSALGIADATPATAHAQLESDQAQFAGLGAAAFFGFGVASAGDVNGDGFSDVIVGAPGYDNGNVDEGAAFIFLGSASGIPDGSPATAHAQIESDSGGARLGSVAAAGDVDGDGFGDVIVGSRLYNSGETNEGLALVFLGSASGIADGTPATAHARFESDQVDARLGSSVASAGDVDGDGFGDVILGAERYSNGQSREGAAFVFLGSASGIADGTPATAHVQLETDDPFDQMGWSVAPAGDVDGDGFADVIVGAPLYRSGFSARGAALVYHGGPTGITDANPASAASRLQSDQPGAELGVGVASAGDVNGDGFADVIVGAPLYDSGQTNEGAAFVFHGGPGGISDAIAAGADTQLESDQDGANLGQSVASAGDVNGDGYGDVIVGAPSYDSGHADEGAAFVFLGSASGVADGNPASAHAQLESDQASAGLGWSVASAGDVNGDGYADVILGAWTYDSGQTDEGAAFVFLGSASGLRDGNPATAHAPVESDQAAAGLGWSVASAGDVNGDGYGDVIAGAWTYDGGQTDEGAAFVFLGSASGIAGGTPSNAHAQLEGDQVNASLASSVASAGDVNGDGLADVIVGALGQDGGQAEEGAAFVFLGSASGLADGDPSTAHARIASEQAGAALGSSVASAGDVNGDGFADVIVGAPLYDNGQTNEGAAFVFLGSASGIADGNPATAHARLESDQAGALSSSSVASAGDVNGDGFADVIVGARSYDSGETNEGAAFVYTSGGNRDGRLVLARQTRGDGSGIPVQPWGASHAETGFAVELRASHPHGTGRVRLQIEACPPAVAFGDPSCEIALSPGWIAVGGAAPDVTISQALTTLPSDVLYRWRARVLHAPATGAIPANPAHGPWRRLGGQSSEADLRLVPEPDASFSLASVAALLAALVRRRRRSALALRR